MTVTMPVPAVMPEGVFLDDLGRAIAPLDVLVPYEGNPRNPDDFDPKKSSEFADLIESIDENGVRHPIDVYVKDDKLYMLSGHRRRAAVIHLNERRREALEARIALGESSPNAEPPDDLKPIPGLPISLVAPPRDEFERRADMWVAESQRQKWPLNQLVPFYKATWEAAPETLRQEPRLMARRLGLPETRIRLLSAIVRSDVMYRAAVDPTEDVLDLPGREKTLRSIIRVAEIICDLRPTVATKVTGRYQADEQTCELVRERVVAKASEYRDRKIPAGVALERTAPVLKDEAQYPDDALVNWLIKPGVIAEDRLPTTVGSAAVRGTSTDGKPSQTTLETVVQAYESLPLQAVDLTELDAVVDEIGRAVSRLDALLLRARSIRRDRAS